MFKKLWLSLEQSLLAKTCLLCHNPAHASRDLCAACEADLPWLEQACRCCANRLPMDPSGDLLCGSCLLAPPPFTKIHALFHYEEPIIHLIAAFKFHKKLAVGRVLSELMLTRFAAHYPQKPDCIIPLPLHNKRLQMRGFNQALELAKPLARQLKIPLNNQACKRHKATLAQAHIPATARAQNVKNAFTVQGDFQGLHVVIIDDVVTTGQTASACSEAFIAKGAARVDIWCCARTPLK